MAEWRRISIANCRQTHRFHKMVFHANGRVWNNAALAAAIIGRLPGPGSRARTHTGRPQAPPPALLPPAIVLNE
jgi:hypothetical protein